MTSAPGGAAASWQTGRQVYRGQVTVITAALKAPKTSSPSVHHRRTDYIYIHGKTDVCREEGTAAGKHMPNNTNVRLIGVCKIAIFHLLRHTQSQPMQKKKKNK